MEQNNNLPLDPDPVSVALIILGAVGSMASILGYLNQVSDRKNAKELQNRYVLSELIETTTLVESSIIEIQGNYEKIRIIIETNKNYSSNYIDEITENDSPKFILGSLPLFLPPADYNKFSKYHLQIVQHSKVLLKNIYLIVKTLYKNSIDISQLTYEKLIRLQTSLNKLISNKLDYEDALNFYSSLLEEAASLTRDMKNEFIPDYGGEPSESKRASNG